MSNPNNKINPNPESPESESPESKTGEELLNEFSEQFFAKYPYVPQAVFNLDTTPIEDRPSLAEAYEENGLTDVRIDRIHVMGRDLHTGKDVYEIDVKATLPEPITTHSGKESTEYSRGFTIGPGGETKRLEGFYEQLEHIESIAPELIVRHGEEDEPAKSKLAQLLGKLTTRA